MRMIKIFNRIRNTAGLIMISVLVLCNAGIKTVDGFVGESPFPQTAPRVKPQGESLNANKLQPYNAAVSYNKTAHSGIGLLSFQTYDFKTLYKSLGYHKPGYFGASSDEIYALRIYATKEEAYYKEINDYLRFYPKNYDWYGTSPEEAEVIVGNMDRFFLRVPVLPADLILFRGISLKFRSNKGYEINEEFTEKAYVSTSSSFKIAKYFAIEKDDDESGDSRKAVLAFYNNRPGEKGILVDQEEDEIILKRGIKFRIMAKKETGEKYDFYLMQICSASCETFLRDDVRYFWDNFNRDNIY